jgi:predicted kinase
MPTLYVMCGLSFSGKTTLATRLAAATGAAFVSYDELYATAERDLTGLEEWRYIVGLVHERTRAELSAGRSVVVDNLNEDRVDRAELRAIADELGVETIVVHVDAPLEVIEERRRRNAEIRVRGHTSDEMFEFVRARFETPEPPERVVRYRDGEDVDEWLARLTAP